MGGKREREKKSEIGGLQIIIIFFSGGPPHSGEKRVRSSGFQWYPKPAHTSLASRVTKVTLTNNSQIRSRIVGIELVRVNPNKAGSVISVIPLAWAGSRSGDHTHREFGTN
jgi:hypothetical protein